MTFPGDQPTPSPGLNASRDVASDGRASAEEDGPAPGREKGGALDEIPGFPDVGGDTQDDFQVTIRRASKEDNDALKTLIKETYTHQQLLKPSLVHELTSPRKFPKFAILGYVSYVLTESISIATLMAFALLSLRLGWTYLWIWLWPRLMIHDDSLYGGMYEKFWSLTPFAGEADCKVKSSVRRKRSCLLVADVKGHGVIGCIGVAPGDSYINPTPTLFQKFAIWILNITPPVAEFKRLMVQEKFRSKGVASKLLEAAFQFCHTNKYKSVTLSTFLVWHKARRLYAKFGLEESDIQMFDFSFHGKNLYHHLHKKQ